MPVRLDGLPRILVLIVQKQAAIRRDGRAARRATGTAGVEGLDPGGRAGHPVRLLRARPAGVSDLHGQAADAAARRRPAGRGALHGRGHHARASRCSCTTGSWSTARCSATAPTSARTSPPTTCGARRTSSGAATAARESDSAARRTIEDFRTNRYDEQSGTLTLTRAAGRGVPAARRPLLALLLRPDDAARAAARRDHRPHRTAPADRVLRLDGVGRIDRAPGQELLLHEQLAARAARRQQADGQRRRVVGALADRCCSAGSGCCSASSAAGSSWAGTAASRPRCRSARRVTSRSRRRSARARGSSS